MLKASKKELVCILPFIGNQSLQLRTCLVNSLENNLKLGKHKVIFQSPCKLSLLFRYKDSLKEEFCSDIVYRYPYKSEVYFKYISNMLKVYFQSIFKVYFKYTWSILQIYFKYASSILQSGELQKKKYTSSLYYFDKRSTFEAHFVKLNQHFNVNLKYTSSIL